MNTKDLATARKNASTDATPQLLSWAEETIADMRKLLQQQAVKIQRNDDEIKRLRAANERLRKALEESTLYVKRAALKGKL